MTERIAFMVETRDELHSLLSCLVKNGWSWASGDEIVPDEDVTKEKYFKDFNDEFPHVNVILLEELPNEKSVVVGDESAILEEDVLYSLSKYVKDHS